MPGNVQRIFIWKIGRATGSILRMFKPLLVILSLLLTAPFGADLPSKKYLNLRCGSGLD